MHGLVSRGKSPWGGGGVTHILNGYPLPTAWWSGSTELHNLGAVNSFESKKKRGGGGRSTSNFKANKDSKLQDVFDFTLFCKIQVHDIHYMKCFTEELESLFFI